MAESRFINHAARILAEVEAGTPADQALRDAFAHERHFAAPRDRRDTARAVFAYFRWLRWLDPRESRQKRLAAAIALQERFTTHPATMKSEALGARAVPDWVKAEMEAMPPEWLRQLQREPVLWIRPKRGLEGKVAATLGHCTTPDFPAAATDTAVAPVPSPWPAEVFARSSALRYAGTSDLYRSPSFQAGDFEIQDLASQLVGLACDPQPGETWWDACAGEGGKSMHLSDLMQNRGVLWVSDRSLRRLAKLKERAARAKVFNFRAAAWEGGAKLPTRTRFDGILVDAPCSGLGTWQRNPHARWTTQPQDVHELAAVQRRLLEHAAVALKPGGRLLYAVCTLTRAETTALAEAFTAAHPELEPAPLGGAGSAAAITLWPQDFQANGMFIAAWRRR